MKLLLLTQGRELSPWLPFLAARGHTFTVLPLANHRKAWWLAQRLVACSRARGHDLVIIEDQLLPGAPVWLERCLGLLCGRPLVYWVNPARRLGSLPPCHGLVVDPRFEHEFSTLDIPVYTLPPVLDRVGLQDPQASLQGYTIGWPLHGNRTETWPWLGPILEEVAKTFAIQLVLLGGQDQLKASFPIDHQASPGRNDAHYAKLDLIMAPGGPEVDVEQERVLLRCMAAGLPVVASGRSGELVEQARAGYGADDDPSWLFGLRKLLGDVETRRVLGDNGRAWVRFNRTRVLFASPLIDFLEKCAGGPT